MRRLIIVLTMLLFAFVAPLSAQPPASELPPVVLYTDDMVVTWTPERGFVDLAPLPTFLDTANRRLRAWISPRYHADSGSFFYVGVSENWLENLNAGIYPDASGIARNIYQVDVYTGDVKIFAGQINAQETPTIERTSLQIIPEAGRLVWLEEHDTTEVVIVDILTGEALSRTTLDITDGLISGVMDDHMVITYLENDGGYIILDVDGTVQYESTQLLPDNFYTFLYDDDGTLYYGSATARISLADFTLSETPNGALIRYAVNAPESSMRLAAPQTDADGRCMADLYAPSGEVIHEAHIYHFGLSPDGREMVYYDWDAVNGSTTRIYLTHVVLGDDAEIPQLHTYDVPDDFNIIGVQWGNTRTTLMRGGDDFRGNFFCGVG